MLNGIAHTTNLTIPTLVNRYANDPRAEKSSLRWSGNSIIEHDSLAKHSEFATSRLAFDVGDVFLLNSKGGMRQPVGKITIVGEKQETLCLHVETTNGKNARLFGYEFENCWTPLRIISGSHYTSWLIQK
jgi:hypothetical protein